MNTMLLAAQAAQGGGMGVFIMMGAILVIFWLFMVRPQQKKQKKIRNFQNSLHGTVKHVNIQDDTVDIEIARSVVITVSRGYIFENASVQMPNA